jgi:hypothetical protein
MMPSPTFEDYLHFEKAGTPRFFFKYGNSSPESPDIEISNTSPHVDS